MAVRGLARKSPLVPAVSPLLQLGVPFVWLGMLVAISFLETPLKFRAPGITTPLALGIGRLVFRTLNLTELALGALLTAALFTGPTPGAIGWALLSSLWAALLIQVGLLRPRLDRRTRALLAGDPPPPSHQHLAYIALDVGKVLALPALGVVLAAGLLP